MSNPITSKDADALVGTDVGGPGTEGYISARSQRPTTTILRGRSPIAGSVKQGFMEKLDPVAIMGMASTIPGLSATAPSKLSELSFRMNNAVSLLHVPLLAGPFLSRETNTLQTFDNALSPDDGGQLIFSYNNGGYSVDPGTGGVLFNTTASNGEHLGKAISFGTPKMTDSKAWLLSVVFAFPASAGSGGNVNANQGIFFVGTDPSVDGSHATGIIGYVKNGAMAVDMFFRNVDGTVITQTLGINFASLVGMNTIQIYYTNDGDTINVYSYDRFGNWNNVLSMAAPNGHDSLNLTSQYPIIMGFGAPDGTYGVGVVPYVGLRMYFENVAVTGAEASVQLAAEQTYTTGWVAPQTVAGGASMLVNNQPSTFGNSGAQP